MMVQSNAFLPRMSTAPTFAPAARRRRTVSTSAIFAGSASAGAQEAVPWRRPPRSKIQISISTRPCTRKWSNTLKPLSSTNSNSVGVITRSHCSSQRKFSAATTSAAAAMRNNSPGKMVRNTFRNSESSAANDHAESTSGSSASASKSDSRFSVRRKRLGCSGAPESNNALTTAVFRILTASINKVAALGRGTTSKPSSDAPAMSGNFGMIIAKSARSLSSSLYRTAANSSRKASAFCNGMPYSANTITHSACNASSASPAESTPRSSFASLGAFASNNNPTFTCAPHCAASITALKPSRSIALGSARCANNTSTVCAVVTSWAAERSGVRPKPFLRSMSALCSSSRLMSGNPSSDNSCTA
mmetsp:Transcript_30374/g.83462  ORF Transcript_30374/g.83462 Transcript_30374/m.83462 type:complete len:361 (+) Transcript_30374:351-1433(+)